MKCTFCGVEIKEATGIIYAKKMELHITFVQVNVKKVF
jgi:ribosomal protein L24E